jgi:hypothetical protein
MARFMDVCDGPSGMARIGGNLARFPPVTQFMDVWDGRLWDGRHISEVTVEEVQTLNLGVDVNSCRETG